MTAAQSSKIMELGQQKEERAQNLPVEWALEVIYDGS